jgi:hypothetical protein
MALPGMHWNHMIPKQAAIHEMNGNAGHETYETRYMFVTKTAAASTSQVGNTQGKGRLAAMSHG